VTIIVSLIGMLIAFENFFGELGGVDIVFGSWFCLALRVSD